MGEVLKMPALFVGVSVVIVVAWTVWRGFSKERN